MPFLLYYSIKIVKMLVTGITKVENENENHKEDSLQNLINEYLLFYFIHE